jgi:hypothetical protein
MKSRFVALIVLAHSPLLRVLIQLQRPPQITLQPEHMRNRDQSRSVILVAFPTIRSVMARDRWYSSSAFLKSLGPVHSHDTDQSRCVIQVILVNHPLIDSQRLLVQLQPSSNHLLPVQPRNTHHRAASRALSNSELSEPCPPHSITMCEHSGQYPSDQVGVMQLGHH